MLKQIIVLFNLISFIIVTALLPADIKIETKIPEGSEFVRDSTYIIEVNITKGPIFGFAKFQQNIPEGFVAHPVETADASFTFADGKVKFIWMAIPETDQVKVSYALIASEDAAAEGVISGKFSYIEENERRSYDIPNIPIKVISDEPVVEKVPMMASVVRNVEVTGENQYRVNLAITKSGLEGFAKLEEFLPDGAEAQVEENSKAVFSQVDDKAKFVWMAVPEDETVNVSYLVSSTDDIEDQLAAMQGNFSFLDENETRTVAILGGSVVDASDIAASEGDDSSDITEDAEPSEETEVAVADDPAVEEAPVEEAPVDEPVVEETPVEEIAAVEEEVIEPVKENVVQDKVDDVVAVTEATNVPTPATGVYYKVQVVAGHKLVSKEFIQKTYRFNEPFSIENHEGWIKYTTGSYDIYKGARDKRQALVTANHNFPGPFVTAYNADERITVQEALMITNQQWFK